MKIQIILLDIGGVIVQFAGIKRLIGLMGNTITPEELSRRWADSEYVKLYESGRCDTTPFANGVIKELSMDISPKNFIDEFRLFTKDFFSRCYRAFKKVKTKLHACLFIKYQHSTMERVM